MIDIQVRAASGRIVERSIDGIEWGHWFADLSPLNYPMLAYVSAVGDTMFNYGQIKVVIAELNELVRSNKGDRESAVELIRLCQVALDGSKYLWFVGD